MNVIQKKLSEIVPYGRHAYCMEFDQKYADVIIDRWEKFTGEKALLLYDD